jgi:putative DNA primase/helicase
MSGGIIEAVKQAAGPAWPQVVVEYGIDPHLLDGRQHPCPVCGAGRDRFRMLKDGRYFCQHCRIETGGFGDWLDLIAGANGITLKQLLTELGRRYNVKTDGSHERDTRMDGVRDLWQNARPARGTIAETYLIGRGLSCAPELRYFASVWEPQHQKRTHAMLAALTFPDGNLASVHRTYLRVLPSGSVVKAPLTAPRKLMPAPSIAGAAIRLFDSPDAETIVVAEGIGTALAARRLNDEPVPAYSLVSTSGMKSFVPPANVKRVLIYGDNDEGAAGQAAAWALCAKLRGKKLDVPDPQIPDVVGTDWLDYLAEVQAAA